MTAARESLNLYIENCLYKYLSSDSEVTVKTEGTIWLSELTIEDIFGFPRPSVICLEAE